MYKNYVIIKDPRPDYEGGFRPGAEFHWESLLDMIEKDWIPSDTVVFSKIAKREYTCAELRPILSKQLAQKISRKKQAA